MASAGDRRSQLIDLPLSHPSRPACYQGTAPANRRCRRASILSCVAEKKDADLALLKKAEAVLAEIDRTQGLIDRHADVLAAIRIRIEGGPRKSLEELMSAA